MTTTLSKVYPKLDKICDAPFIKKVLGTTKKDAVAFLTENAECRRFFEAKEAEIDRHNELVQNDIQDFLQQPSIQLEVSKFKSVIKERQAKEKADRKALEKQAIIEEYLRQQEKEKLEAAERTKLGMSPKAGTAANAASSSTTKTQIKPKAELGTNNQLQTLSSSSEDEDDADAAAATTTTTTKKVAAEADQDDQDGTNSSEETVLNLDDFYQMFLAVYDQGHIQIKNGNTVVKAQIKMDEDSQKIIIQTKTTPTISIKK